MSRKLTTEEFIERAKKVHGDKYDYSKVVYVRKDLKIVVVCQYHGEFYPTPSNHVHKKSGCPMCYFTSGARKRLRNNLEKKYKNVTQPEDYKLIPLSQGKFAKVDNEDFESLRVTNWYVCNGYADSNDKGYMHRYIVNPKNRNEVDHINHDTLDNRRCNLRECDSSQNKCNKFTQDNNILGVKGVCKTPSGKYVARIYYKGVKYRLGTFNTLEEASESYKRKSDELHGEFSNY